MITENLQETSLETENLPETSLDTAKRAAILGKHVAGEIGKEPTAYQSSDLRNYCIVELQAFSKALPENDQVKNIVSQLQSEPAHSRVSQEEAKSVFTLCGSINGNVYSLLEGK